jgi:pimeloyl-ACP methyl ester carboxylesterase
MLVPGATYSGVYWDFPYRPETYNFRQVMNGYGIATFVVDRLGTGASSRPLGATLTAQRQADALHATISALRAGRIGGQSFARVIAAGHSLGSFEVALEAAEYRDVSGVLLTGFTHQINPLFFAKLGLYLNTPAPLDPTLAAQGYSDLTYLTTAPGTREAAFTILADTDPGIGPVDEATKSVMSTAELTALTEDAIPQTSLIDVPVVEYNGSLDQPFCDPLVAQCASAANLLASEAPYFGQAACLQTAILDGAGHDLNLEMNAPDYQARVAQWVLALTDTGDGCSVTF